VEGSEAQALRGSVNTIRTYQPDLLVSLYHRTEDLHELILQIHEISPDYRLYLRRYPYIPAWDLNLYASVK
jgi:predicted transposase YdaD